jgi:anti-anti-sigma regulatory factor
VHRFGDQFSDEPRDGLATVEVGSLPGGGVVVALTGDHDLSTKQQVLTALAGLGPKAHLIIDLARCTFVDSTIISAILGAVHAKPPRTQTVSLVLPDDTSYVYRALSVIGMRDLVPVHRSIEAALESESPTAGSPRPG